MRGKEGGVSFVGGEIKLKKNYPDRVEMIRVREFWRKTPVVVTLLVSFGFVEDGVQSKNVSVELAGDEFARKVKLWNREYDRVGDGVSVLLCGQGLLTWRSMSIITVTQI